MKLKIIIIFLFLFSFAYSYSFNEYEADIVGLIQTGTGISKIGYDAEGLPGDGPLTAKKYAISPTNKLYIFDKFDSKIQIYTLDLLFIKEFPVKKYNVLSILHMKVSEQGDLILVDSFGLKKINSNGKLIYEVSTRVLPDEVIYNENYFPYGEYVFFTDDKNNIQCISPAGIYLTKNEVSDIINQNFSINTNTKSDLDIELNMEIKNFSNTTSLLLFNNLVKSTNDVLVINKYYNQLSKNKKLKGVAKVEYELPPYTSQYLYLGCDNDNNTYWKRIVEEGIFVFNIYGQLIDMFKKYNNKETAVSPAGDVYFWEVKPDGVFFYKITRRW